ncbi:MAG TPA: tryptophan halogenase family protein [Allosphingosinicella sp.]|nr:tryptophan halogenase family protein [Allosphingosinicella sp.]
MKLVILGEGIAGWAAAAMLAGALPEPRYTVSLVPTGGPDDSLGPFGPAEAALPSIRELHVRLGLDEDGLIRQSNAGYALGAAFSGWSSAEPAFFLPFGDIGAPLGTVPFHQLAGRLRAAGDHVRFGNFSVATIAAQMGRFARPSDDPSSVLSTYSYGLHLPLGPYARALRDLALARGVRIVETPFVAAELGEQGALAGLRLASAESVTGEFFIDASGPSALLSEGALASGFESWRAWLPCDRAAASGSATPVPPAPYSHVEAGAAGWRRVVPYQGGVGELIVSCSAAADERGTAFEAGRRKRPWIRNCVAIGAAAATVEPLQSTSLDLLHRALARLLRLFPAAPDATSEAAEYNRSTNEELDRLRDRLILPYKLNGRRGEPFWDQLRYMAVPDPLAHKIALYQSRGRVPLLDGDMFEESEWAALFDSFGLRPRRYDARADALPIDRIRHHLASIRSIMLEAAAKLPSHRDYLARSRARESAA